MGSKIEWTNEVWNPVSGCTRVSAGCDHCYAVGMTHRLEAMGQTEKYGGLTVLNNKGERHFNGAVRCHEKELDKPLRWQKPRRVFVNSMSDLFHPAVPFDFIDQVFAVMALCPQHTFQVLTKRPKRMAEYLDYAVKFDNLQEALDWLTLEVEGEPFAFRQIAQGDWPIDNIWLGVSVEDQAAADERIPHLLKCPAAVRFLSCEPLLGPVDLTKTMVDKTGLGNYGAFVNPLKVSPGRYSVGELGPVSWVIVGGESGPGARPCYVEWIESIIKQCRDADVKCFVKQLGKLPMLGRYRKHYDITNPKGGDTDEWPAALRVRDFPKTGNEQPVLDQSAGQGAEIREANR